jgi:hypothetical protein
MNEVQLLLINPCHPETTITKGLLDLKQDELTYVKSMIIWFAEQFQDTRLVKILSSLT